MAARFVIFAGTIFIGAGERCRTRSQSSFVFALFCTSLGAFVPVIAGLTAGFIIKTGTILVGAGEGSGAVGEAAEIGAGFAVIVFYLVS